MIEAGGKLAVGPAEAARLLSWNRNGIYEEIAAGRLKSFKAGKRRLIRVAELAAWAERRELLANPATARGPRGSQTVGASVLPFPDMGTGVETDRAASSAAGRSRSASKKKAALSGN